MFRKINTGLLLLALAELPAGLAKEPIRVSVDDGQKRAEFRLNGELECVLQDQRITCVPISR
jgi:hypothetical protein